MSTRLLVCAAFAASISLVTGLATPAPITPMSDPDCQVGGNCESTCGEDQEGVQITEVCMTLDGVTTCECCCYYADMT